MEPTMTDINTDQISDTIASTAAVAVSRRGFMQGSAAVTGGLMLGVSLPASGPVQAAGMMHTPNAFVHIADDNTITLISARSEMGQGVYTSMPMLIAEELNVDINKIQVAIAPPGAAYTNALLGGQITGGSTSVREGWEKLRIAGAQVRIMLIAAAAQQWGVDASTLRAVDGRVIAADGKSATYGSLAEAASKLTAPEKVTLKDPSQFRVVGKRIKRLDTPAKVNGTAVFGIDVKLPGMVYATLAMCPVIGGTVKSFDAARAKTMPGVIDVVQIPDGIAVVASSYWQARKARETMSIVWDEGANAGLTTQAMLDGTRAAATSGKGAILARPSVGDADSAIARGAVVLRAEYLTQSLSHSPLEPMNFTADVSGGKCLLVGPTQFQQMAQGAVAAVLSIKPDDVTLQTTFLGGGFGRRIDIDFIIQAAQISKAVGKPVKLIWSREDDTTHDFYRPMAVMQLAASLGADGKPMAMTFRVASQSITGRLFGLPPEALDAFMAEAAVAPYNIPATRHDVVKHDAGLRVGYWRAVSHNMNAFANESFIDELAAAAKQDPLAYRMSLLQGQPRFLNVLKLAADKSGWGTAAASGRTRGVALMEGYDTYMAQVAEISMVGGEPKVHRVTVVADLGRMVNPDTVEAQIQSSIVFGLSAALWGEITVDKGRVQQTNFHNYRIMRSHEAPQIDIVLVDSTEKPGGIGEPATALIGPAVANAMFASTGKRVRRMPFTVENIQKA
jgi:isoquinoline 1-oxidoreductase beta subunit